MEVVEDDPDVGQASAALEQWIRDEAYVLSENAGASHAPTGSETYNSHGGENFVQRLGTGRYAVHAQFINESFGNVQVVAYGRDPIRCKTSGWSTGSSRYLNSLLVNVLCHNERGLPADSQFAMYFLGKPLQNNRDHVAYAWADTTQSHMLTNSFSYNGSGEVIELSRNSVGTYFVMLHGLPATGPMGQLQVTAYGSGSEYCTVNGHTVAHYPSKDLMYAVVNCWNNAGTRADSLFTMLYTTDSLGSGTIDNAFLYANDSDNNSYTPPAAYQFSTTSTEDGQAGRTLTSDPVRGTNTTTGSYFYDLGEFATRLPLVTARDATGGYYCKVAHRAYVLSKVSVYCFEPATGRRANSKWYGMALDPG